MNIEALKSKIENANKVYRDGKPIMSDIEFDELLEKFQSLVSEDEYNEFRDSLHEVKGKIKHPFIMGSLDKLKTEEPNKIIDFIKKTIKTSLNASAKVDGISCRIHFGPNGEFVSASTRGNGEFGEDITDKVNFVKYVPATVDKDLYDSDVRGELVILKDDFSKLTGFANPRNACAGIMNRKDWNQDDVSCVSFVAYTILGDKHSKKDQFTILKNNHFNVAWNNDYAIDENTDLVGLVDVLTKIAETSYDYDTDGVVICDSSYHNESKYRPDTCVAVKINQLQAITKLLDIDWEGPSKDGFFIPVGLIEPVQLGGSTISRVTLHNLDFIEEKGLKYGSTISIVKSGDIIPKVVKVIANDAKCVDITPLEVCPSCGCALVRDGVNVKCDNALCGDKVLTELNSFIRRLGVKSVTEKSLSKFRIDSFDKLANFTANKKKKSEVKLEDEIYSKIFTRSPRDLISAMNFSGIASKILDKIFDHYGYEEIEKTFIKDDMGVWTVDYDALDKITSKSLPLGVGTQFMIKFENSLDSAVNFAHIFIDHVRYHYSKTEISNEAKSEIKGYIVVTGSLKSGSRTKFLEKAKSFGWESKGAVNKQVTYLINNDITSNSSKNRKAKELGVKIISEDEFLKMCNSQETDLDSL